MGIMAGVPPIIDYWAICQEFRICLAKEKAKKFKGTNQYKEEYINRKYFLKTENSSLFILQSAYPNKYIFTQSGKLANC